MWHTYTQPAESNLRPPWWDVPSAGSGGLSRRANHRATVLRPPTGWFRNRQSGGILRHIGPHSLRRAATLDALDALDVGVPPRDSQILARHADPLADQTTTTALAAISTATASTS